MTAEDWVIQHVRVVSARGIQEDAFIRVTGGIIREVGTGASPYDWACPVIDGQGSWLLPGFIDMHVHGGNGADVMDGSVKSVERIGRFHAAHGTTAWLPTTLTASENRLMKALDAVRQASDEARLIPTILGVHLEGPFIAPNRRGAQNPEFIQAPSVAVTESLMQRAPGLVRCMTLAPERPGGLDLVRWLGQRQVLVSMGHTDASSDLAEAAIEAGVRRATHLFNGMRGLHHREGGPVTAALLDERVVCEVIADGQHVTWDVLKLVVKVKGPDGITLITDAMAAAGQPDGVYDLGGLPVEVKAGRACLAGTEQLAGSTLTMDQAVRNMAAKVGVSLPDVVRMASTTPARQLGLVDCKGDIAAGMDADFVLMDESMSVLATWVQGCEVYRRS
ncbi:MAG: N-acetylglucosamine-6-phosphate deacetylase [Alicyclobacillus herbarius]|uniref:N-acetylglucosamine-6-phosphate deacetylase n=1 Tax=Alicyclobacillus herbarius TaxID=122960 RepID=UPI0023529598|nr:N-acetylglucosamine-6-phosphate deacetylase [Alicyclobacillus herbarius]MCL6632800.1 N-acetylglucosamine-6-phosphate deacetylase [Alicyclobacillus herbarius]